MKILIRRTISDVIVLTALVGGYALMQSLERNSIYASRFTGRNFLIIWTTATVILASVRGALDTRFFGEHRSTVIGLAEWFIVVVGANFLIGLLDILSHPEYSFRTVITLGLLAAGLPSVIASTLMYLLVSQVTARSRSRV
jgi:hypothetical protein